MSWAGFSFLMIHKSFIHSFERQVSLAASEVYQIEGSAWCGVCISVFTTMPLIMGNNAGSHESSDIQAAATLYCKTVPALLRLQDREEQSSQLAVRMEK